MAKLKGPLFSESAHGMVGPRLTFSRRATGQQARFQKANKDAKSSLQLTQRDLFLEALGYWNTLTTDEKELWSEYNKE